VHERHSPGDRKLAGEIEETAKATGEVAKAAGKGIDALSGLGNFFERIFGRALEEAGGILADSIRFRRGGSDYFACRNVSMKLELRRTYKARCARLT
jgi:hypothetical protein